MYLIAMDAKKEQPFRRNTIRLIQDGYLFIFIFLHSCIKTLNSNFNKYIVHNEKTEGNKFRTNNKQK